MRSPTPDQTTTQQPITPPPSRHQRGNVPFTLVVVLLACWAFAAMALAQDDLTLPQDHGLIDAQVDERPEAIDDAIDRYEAIVDAGGWEPIPEGPALHPGAQSEQVPALSARLRASGDLTDAPQEQAVEPATYDAALAHSVRRFQHRHGLQADGIVGPATRAVLNVPAEARLAQLRATRERMEELEVGDAGTVVVNLPEFRLYLLTDTAPPLSMRVIVGKPAWETPEMKDAITRLEFNPYWNIPAEIVAAELAPKVAENLAYLEENDMEVVRGGFFSDERVDPAEIDWAAVRADNFAYFVRQKPGKDNPLGRVKFLFPNEDDIYLHDTPNAALFDQPRRAESHGCIRVEEPFALAERLVGLRRTHEARLSRDTRVVELEEPVPVHLVYWTAWMDEDGVVHFREDLYDRDDLEETS